MSTIWGYARVSTPKQKLDRQIENIRRVFPAAVIIAEEYTGATTDRPKWNGLTRRLVSGDTVVFDEVSRMSRNAEEGMALYEQLYDQGVHLVFLKESYVNTDVFREKMAVQIARQTETGSASTDRLISALTSALHDYMIDVAKEQIQLAFQAAEHELEYLHQRTREGVRRAQAEGKQVGHRAGERFETAKSKRCKPLILKHSKSFGGSLNDEELKKMLGISYGSLYKYKKELRKE